MSGARWVKPVDKADVERLFMEYLALQDEPQDRIGFAKTWREALRATSKFKFAVVGNNKARVTAFATVHEAYSTHVSGNVIRVEDLFVDPEHAGQGHRLKLVEFAEDYAKRHKAKHVDIFLQPATALDPDFLPSGYHPLEAPPFRKSLGRNRSTSNGAVSVKSAVPRPKKTPNLGKKTKVPTGAELTELFR